MRIYALLLLAFSLLGREKVLAQQVTLSLLDHLSESGRLSIGVTAPLDTTGTAELTGIFYIGNIGANVPKELKLNRKGDKLEDSLILKNKRFGLGIHSFLLHFADNSERAFTVFTTSDLKDRKGKNLYERITFTSNGAFYSNLIGRLKDKLRKDSATLMHGIPKGLKCVVALDFFSVDQKGIDDPASTLYCSVVQYRLVDAGGPSETVIRDAFLQEQTDSPLYGLLSTGWLMDAGSFLGNVATIKSELLPDGYQLALARPSDTAVDAHLQVNVYSADQYFRRVLIFIDN